jgi:hypothetical protein
MRIITKEDDEFIESHFKSTDIKKCFYNKKTHLLRVFFVKGNISDFNNVTDDDHRKFVTAQSQGKAFRDYIKKYGVSKK